MADELKSNRARVVEATEGNSAKHDAPVAGNRFANFIYHYKIPIIFGVIALIMVGFTVFNHFASDKNADVSVILALPVELSANDGKEIAAAVRSVQGDDAKKIAIIDMTWYSEFDLENLTSAKRSLVDAKENQAEYDRFQSELTNSDALLLFISPQLESQIKSALVPLSEIFGEDAVPQGSVDDPYAIRLGDTDFYEYFTAASELPQNTRICVRRASAAPAVGDGERGKRLEADAFAVLRAIALFKSPLKTDESETEPTSSAVAAETSADTLVGSDGVDAGSITETDALGASADASVTAGEKTPTIYSLTVPAAYNKNLCADIVGQIGDGVITLPICSPTDTLSLRRAYVEVSTDAASYSLSSLDTESVDLLAPGGCFCTLTDDAGREYRYEVILDLSGRHIPVVSVDTASGQGVWSRDEYTDAVISIDAEGVDSWYLPDGFSSLGATGVSIKGRGNSTWEWPKKPYKLKFPAKTPILGLTAAKKWVLLANYSDYTLMRNYVAMEASKVLSPETSPLSQYPVDLFIDGEYVGVYTIGEDHNVAAGRIELPKNDGGDDVSFVIEVGGYKEEKHVWGTSAYTTDLLRAFSIEYPEPDEITQTQSDRIIGYLERAEAAIVALDGYEEYIDVDSFADWFISNEFFYNLESCFRRSCFLQKKPGERLKMGPIWDHDLALGNLYNDFGRYDIWASLALEYEYVEDNWFCYLMRDGDFVAVVRRHWNEKKDALLSRALYCIDNMEQTLASSASYNFAKWNMLGTRSVRPQPLSIVNYPTFADNVAYIRNFVVARYDRMNELIG